jgi:hypothetical protein
MTIAASHVDGLVLALTPNSRKHFPIRLLPLAPDLGDIIHFPAYRLDLSLKPESVPPSPRSGSSQLTCPNQTATTTAAPSSSATRPS